MSLLLLLATAAALTAPTSRRWTWAHSGGGPVDIHYTACGPADARSCVVFAPGFGAGSFQFEEVASLVAARGHAVYCMDWFGQGKSWPDEARAQVGEDSECGGAAVLCCDAYGGAATSPWSINALARARMAITLWWPACAAA